MSLNRACAPAVAPDGHRCASNGATTADERAIQISTTRDRMLLRAFLEQDRLRAAYAICDLEAREFARSKWGIAIAGRAHHRRRPRVRRPHAAAAVRDGRRRGDRRDPARRRSGRASSTWPLTVAAARVERVYRIDPGPQMMRMVVNRQMFQPVHGPALRLSPVDIVDLNRLYGLGFAGWLPGEAIAQRRLLRRSASPASWSPRPARTSSAPRASSRRWATS